MAVSIPARELAAVELPGSLYTFDCLMAAAISSELQCALRQIKALAVGMRKEPVFVARPELFTEGATLAWLRDKLGPIRDHVCLSDGSTVRLIPGMQNHVFFYALGRQGDFDALGRLESRVPELFSALASQINSALRFQHGRRSYSPPSVVLHHRTESEPVAPHFFRFYLNRHASEDSAARMQNAAAPDALTSRCSKLVYVPLTETAISDRSFMHLISTLVEQHYFGPAGRLILGLPRGLGHDGTIAARLRELSCGFQAVASRIPRVVADHVYVASEDIDLKLARRQAGELELLLHDTFDFWRWAPEAYKAFDGIGVVVQPSRHQVTALSSLLRLAYGRMAQVVRPPTSRRAAG